MTRGDTIVIKAIKRHWLRSVSSQGVDPVLQAATRADIEVTDAVFKLVSARLPPAKYAPDIFRATKTAVIRARSEGQPLQIHEDTKRIDTLVADILKGAGVRGGGLRVVKTTNGDTKNKVTKVTRPKAKRSPYTWEVVLPTASTAGGIDANGVSGSTSRRTSGDTTPVGSGQNSAGNTPVGSPDDTAQRKSGRARTEKKFFGE